MKIAQMGLARMKAAKEGKLPMPTSLVEEGESDLSDDATSSFVSAQQIADREQQ